MLLNKIRSGGQTGADQGGLAAAYSLIIPTDGWVPKGALTERGEERWLIQKYGLKEIDTVDYAKRTRLNVRDSDGTAWFGKVGSRGYACTRKAADKFHKPFELIHNAEELRSFLTRYNIKELNVAGNRESRNPGIYQFTYNIITEALL